MHKEIAVRLSFQASPSRIQKMSTPVFRGSADDESGGPQEPDRFERQEPPELASAPENSPRMQELLPPEAEGLTDEQFLAAQAQHEIYCAYIRQFNKCFADRGVLPSENMQQQIANRLNTSIADMSAALDRPLTLEEHDRLFTAVLPAYEGVILQDELRTLCQASIQYMFHNHGSEMKVPEEDVTDLGGGNSTTSFDTYGDAEKLIDKARETFDLEAGFQDRYLSAQERRAILINIVQDYYRDKYQIPKLELPPDLGL